MKDLREFINDFYDGKAVNGLYSSQNENGEQIIVSITDEALNVSTYQNNGWIRRNIYHKDHTTEEIYDR